VSESAVTTRLDAPLAGGCPYVSPKPYGKSGSYEGDPTWIGTCAADRGQVIGSLPVGA
jgi:hypothetical protein